MKKYIAPFLISLTFLITGIFTISDYGINWDSPCRMLRGQAFTKLLFTGQKNYLENHQNRTPPNLINSSEYVTHYDFVSCEGLKQAELTENPLPRLEYEKALGKKRISFYQHPAWDGEVMIVEGRTGHPPLPEMLGTLSNWLFFGMFGVLGDIESYSFVNLFMSAIGVFIITLFTLEITGSLLAGVVAGLALGLFPLYFAESHFNLKDPLQASFYAGAVWSFWHWIKGDKLGNWKFYPGWWLVFTIFTALAMAVKWNIVFLPIILGFWLLFIKKYPEFKAWFKFKKLLLLFLISLIICLLFLIIIWPASWNNTLDWLKNLLFYYFFIGAGNEAGQPEGFNLPLGFNAYPLALFLTQTPEIVLGLMLIGAIKVFRGKREDNTWPGFLILLWLLVPLIRYSLPFARSYGGLKQVMEILPAAAILSGIGFHYLNQMLKNKFQRYLYSLLCIIAFLYLIFNIISLHPNQNAYFNSFIGGLKGAEKANLVDLMLTNGNVYKQGIIWLNENAEKNAKLAIVDGRMMAASPLWLRNDISLSPNHFSGLNRKGEYIFMAITSQKRDFFGYHYPKNFLNPIHTISVDGVPILYIFKNDRAHSKEGYKEESDLSDYQVRRISKPTNSYFEIDLKKKVKVTRLLVTNPRRECPNKNFYSFTDEFIIFDPSDKVYAINERKYLGQNQIEYSFPGEETTRIRIFPQSDNSCFIGGKILSINVLKE